MKHLRYSTAILLAAYLMNLTSSTALAADILDLIAKKDLPPLRYTNAPAQIPNYPAGKRWGTLADPFDQMQSPLAPPDSARRIVTHPGFEAKLWAEEPQIYKPLCLAFDERGRLWIAETLDYPNEQQPEGEGRDRIRICEDTDHDGRGDKFTVFADQLSIPTGMVFANGGLIVKHANEMLLLQDTNGDDRADERKVLFNGWNMRDTHATASNLRYGFDGWIWGTVGYSGFRGTVGGKELRFGQGVFRFKPDGSALEFVKSSNNNTWGLGLSEDNIVFGSTANGNASFYMPIPNRYYEAVRGWSASQMGTIADSQAIYPIATHVRQVDWHGRYTAGAGHALYTARAFPKEYWNKVAFVTEPTGHLIGKFRLVANGADFIAHNERSFLANDDEWFAPIMAEVGPDGALWVLDWYNYIVQHNPTPAGFRTGKGAAYETPLRDKTHGRIYRVVYSGETKGTSAQPTTPSLRNATAAQLVATLKNDNQLWRLHAQRLLVERGNVDVVPALLSLVNDSSVDEIGLNVAAVHALWTLYGLGAMNTTTTDASKAALTALRHPSPAVRRAALMTLPRVDATTTAILSGQLLSDSDAQVRMAALLALAETPVRDEVGPAVLAMLQKDENAKDKWIPHAATAAAGRNDASFLKAVLASGSADETLGKAVRVVTGHYALSAPTESVIPTVLSLDRAAPPVATAILDGLAANWPRGTTPKFTPGDEAKLAALMSALPNDARSSLVTLAARWDRKDLFASATAAIVKTLRGQVADANLTPEQRTDAATRLLATDDSAASISAILAPIVPTSLPALASGLLGVLANSRQPETGPAIIGAFSKFTPAVRRTALATLLRRAEWASALLKAIENRQLQRSDLAAEHWTQLKAHSDSDVAAKARSLDRAATASSAEMELLVQKLMPIAQQKGDTARGKELFTKNCIVCHTLNGEGAKIGPDLTGAGAKPKTDLLIEIIDPNRSVEANYRMWNVTTKNGENYAGRLDSETATSVDLLDTTGKQHTLQRHDIAEMNASPLSIMPTGFEQWPPADLAALLEYLVTAGHAEGTK